MEVEVICSSNASDHAVSIDNLWIFCNIRREKEPKIHQVVSV
jgi:hypothetical protein